MIRRALVTDGKESTTLAVMKSLGKKGVTVTVGDDSRLAPSRFSRYCSRFFTYPSPEADWAGYLEKILDELKKSRADMFFLTSDTQIPVLIRCWNEISALTRIAAPPPEILIQAFDKSKTLELAKALGVPFPKTVVFTGDQEDLKKASELLKFPVVVKYSQTYFWQNGALRAAPRVQYAFTPAQLKTKTAIDPCISDIPLGRLPAGHPSSLILESPADFLRGKNRRKVASIRRFSSRSSGIRRTASSMAITYATVNNSNQKILLQEFIPGAGIGIFGLFRKGEPLVLFSHERLREANPTGGASAESKSIPVDPQGKKFAAALMKALGWTGAAMIEFKKDFRTGELKLMEINGRFWGSLPLALRCGIDFPVLLAELLETGKISPPPDYPVGIRCRHVNRWLTHILHVLKGRPKGWKTPYPGRLETLADFLKVYQKNLYYYGWDRTDPLPEIMDWAYWINANFTKLFRRVKPA